MNTDEDHRATFLMMPLNEQLGILYDMLRYVRGELSTLKKSHYEFEEELRDFRKKREERERFREDDLTTTTQKIRAIIEATEAKRWDFWIYMRDKVMPQVITLILLALLYLTFGTKP